jgi:glyoxylate/hydroxypyruvate reductase
MSLKHKLYVAMLIPDELVTYLESNNLEVTVAKNVPVPRDELLRSVGDCDAIFCTPSITLDKELLDLALNLKVIGTLSVGYNHIDLHECHVRNIKVGYTPGVLDDPVAEFAVTLTLNTIKRISESIEAAKMGEWILGDLFWMCGTSIFESNVGIFGLGRVGKNTYFFFLN